MNIQDGAIEAAATSDCTCFMVDPKYWTTHYGAVEPGSMYEPNPECPEHFPEQHEHEEWQIAPSARGGMYCTACGRKVNVDRKAATDG